MTTEKTAISAAVELGRTDTIPSLRWSSKPMPAFTVDVRLRLFISKEDLSIIKLVARLMSDVTPLGIFSTFRINICVR